MKTKFIIVLTIMMVLILNMTISYANTTYGIFLNINPEEIKIGETFTVTLSANCNDGINGIDTTYSYDENKLELVSAEVADSKNWANLGTDNQITVICNSTETITEADIYILTFKVKENVIAGDTAIISTTEILLDSDAETNSEIMIDAKELSITVASEEEENPPTNPDDDSNTENPDNDTTEKPDDNSQNGQQNNIITSKPGDIDNLVSADKLPYTGTNLMIILGIIGLTILAIVFYKINKKYKNI